jgi:small subunit ribosomal protein S17
LKNEDQRDNRDERGGAPDEEARSEAGEFALAIAAAEWAAGAAEPIAFAAARRCANRDGALDLRDEGTEEVVFMADEATTIVNKREERGTRKTRVGEVISSGMNKTIVVRTVTRVPHPKFGKIVKQKKKFYAHDEESKAKDGDTVRIMETRPLSKLKRWRLVEVMEK